MFLKSCRTIMCIKWENQTLAGHVRSEFCYPNGHLVVNVLGFGWKGHPPFAALLPSCHCWQWSFGYRNLANRSKFKVCTRQWEPVQKGTRRQNSCTEERCANGKWSVRRLCVHLRTSMVYTKAEGGKLKKKKKNTLRNSPAVSRCPFWPLGLFSQPPPFRAERNGSLLLPRLSQLCFRAAGPRRLQPNTVSRAPRYDRSVLSVDCDL